jgi:hypothetical protein
VSQRAPVQGWSELLLALPELILTDAHVDEHDELVAIIELPRDMQPCPPLRRDRPASRPRPPLAPPCGTCPSLDGPAGCDGASGCWPASRTAALRRASPSIAPNRRLAWCHTPIEVEEAVVLAVLGVVEQQLFGGLNLPHQWARLPSAMVSANRRETSSRWSEALARRSI